MTTTLEPTLAPTGVTPDDVGEPSPPLATGRRRRRLSPATVALWVILTLLIIAPVMCFLLLATSPRLFGQGHELFTLKYLAQAFQGQTGQGIFNSLWVSTTVSLLAVVVATTVAWLVQRTNILGRRV
ncbi:MAG: hypothetical protein ACYC19_10745, partial [Acidimicrobiales bacterium]